MLSAKNVPQDRSFKLFCDRGFFPGRDDMEDDEDDESKTPSSSSSMRDDGDSSDDEPAPKKRRRSMSTSRSLSVRPNGTEGLRDTTVSLILAYCSLPDPNGFVMFMLSAFHLFFEIS